MDKTKKAAKKVILVVFIIASVAFMDGFFSELLGNRPILYMFLGQLRAEPSAAHVHARQDAPSAMLVRPRAETQKPAATPVGPVLHSGNSIERIISADYFTHVRSASRHCGIDSATIVGLISKESSGDPRAFNSTGGGGGAIGLLQIRRPAALDLGVAHGQGLFDPKTNIDAGVRYLCMKLSESRGDLSHALLGYLLGMGEGKTKEGGLAYIKAGLHPREHPYVADVLERTSRARKALGST
jgi:soluble lytic murein transglycosylase-like protein